MLMSRYTTRILLPSLLVAIVGFVFIEWINRTVLVDHAEPSEFVSLLISIGIMLISWILFAGIMFQSVASREIEQKFLRDWLPARNMNQLISELNVKFQFKKSGNFLLFLGLTGAIYGFILAGTEALLVEGVLNLKEVEGEVWFKADSFFLGYVIAMFIRLGGASKAIKPENVKK